MSEDANPDLAVDGGLVVADDGSPHARLALRWAVEEARLRRCTLHVVRAWSIQTAPRPQSWRLGYVPSLAEYEGRYASPCKATSAMLSVAILAVRSSCTRSTVPPRPPWCRRPRARTSWSWGAVAWAASAGCCWAR